MKRNPAPLIIPLVLLGLLAVGLFRRDLSRSSPEFGPPLSKTRQESPRAARQSLPGGAELKGPLPDVDRRETRVAASAERAAQMAELRRRVPGVTVDDDPVTGSPKWLGSPSAFLTGPQEALAAADADAPILAFLEAHRGLFGHGPELLQKARRVTDYATVRGPSRKVVWHQQYQGIDIFEAVLQANLTTKSELINIGSQMVADPEAAVQGPRQPVLAVERAVAAAGRDIGENVTAESVRAVAPAEARPDRRQQFRAALLTDADARLVWLPLAADRMRLAWDVTLTSRSRSEMYRVLVDAENGSVQVRQALTALISDASYRVYTASSPTPMAPGQQTPSSLQPAEVARVLVTTPALNTTASPNGWINDGDNLTSGNNVDAYTDTNADNVPDLPRTTGTPARVFDFPMDTTQAPSTYKDASVTQIFYWSNFMHDRLHELGFTEAAGNFQVDNFGRGGLGNDPVNAEALDGSGTNNANFSTPVDGNRGRMQMYVWTSMAPDRDSTFDTTVLFHEYGHGVSNRLVGGPSVTLSANTSRGMGEGWSDFYGMTLLTEAAENPHGNWPAAGYLSLLRAGWLTENYYYGLRRYSYSTDLTKNPLTFKDTDPTQIDLHPEVPRNPTYGSTQDATQVHYLGTVWCTMLNEVRANLMVKHGALAGNERAMFLVTEGMKYAPANPNFVQSRDGILQAALVNHPEDVGEVWSAFAKRGLGDGASAPASSTTTGVVESYKVPDSLEIDDRRGWNITGNKGGPFAPATQTLTLSNDGTAPLSWSVDPGAAWLAVAPAGGTLAAGGSLEVTVTVQADAVESGFHSANVVFTNTGTSFQQPVGVRLQVTPPVVERFDFDSNPGWATTGEWQFGVPTGAGGSAAGGAGQADPVAGATGTQVYGVNLNGNAGTALGGPYYLVSEPVDLSTQKQTRLRFKRWLNTNAQASTRATVEVSTDGVTWREVFVNPGMAITDNAWQTLEYDLSSFADQQSAVRVRWGYQNLLAGSAYSGWNLDDVEFLGEPTVHFQVLAAAEVAENGAPLSATVEISHVQDQDLSVLLASSDPGAATVPASVTLQAGQTSAGFLITPVDDALLDGTQTTRITASLPAGVADGQHVLAVTDSETAVLTLTAPADLTEGAAPVAASVQVDLAPSRDVTVQLESNSPGLQVPASVVIPAGSTGPVGFFLEAPDNLLAEGSLAALLTATVANWTPGTAAVTVQDDESPVILLTGPGTVREGDAPASYTVTVNTVQAVDRVVNLTSDEVSEIVVPATVTVPAGAFSASFDAVIQDDAQTDGGQSVTLTAAAAGFSDATRAVTVADNDVHAFGFAPIASPQLRNQPFDIRIRALDVNGEWITNHAGVVSLSAVAGAGAPPMKPNSVGGFINGEARADVEVGGAVTGLTLVAEDAAGRTGTSNAFDVIGRAHAGFQFAGIPTSVNADTWFNFDVSAVDDTGALATGYQDATQVDVLTSQFERYVGSTGSSTSTSKLQNTAFHDSRAQILYTKAELGTQPRLISAFIHSRVTSGGQAMANYTVRLKHTHLDSFEGQGWEEGGWTTVYGPIQFGAGGVNQVFREPFWYDGVSNLMVDISFDNSSASTAGTVRTLVTSQPRMLTGTSNSEHGPPTTWSPLTGPVPELSNEVPVITLYEARSRGAIPASPAVFSAGTWSGQAFTVSGTVWLRATAPSGVWGTSSSIAVLNPSITLGANTVFSEGFESGTLGANWSTAANSGSIARTQVTYANTPRSGSYHLTMDTTSSSTGIYAANRPTLSLDLTGQKHVSIEWYRKGFADESHLPALQGPLGTFGSTASFDGVAISRDGVTWVEAASLRALPSTYSSLGRVFLDPLLNRLGWPLDGVYQIRFSQYDDQAIPNDGIAIDDILVRSNSSSAIQVELPATIAEGTQNQTVTVRLPTAPAAGASVTLTSNGPARLSVVSPVVIPAGQTSATTTISASQNQYAEVGRDLIITASASGYATGHYHIRVVDDEQPVLTLELPASIAEGGPSGAATVRIDPVQPVATPVFLVLSDAAEATVVSYASLAAGAASANFTLNAVNDLRLDGTRTVTLTASGQGLASASDDFEVLDNESTQLQVTPPAALAEGGAAGLGRIQLSGVRSVDTLVTLVSSDPGEATVSESVQIPAGQVGANFQVFPVDDSLQDGAQSVTVTASASGLDDGSASFEVRDDDPASFEVAVIASPQVRNAPFSVTLTARDGADNVLTGFQGTVNLSALAGATPLPLTPQMSGPFVNGVWTGEVAIGAAATDVTLTATGSDGATGTSDAFAVVPGGGAVALAFAPVPSPQRAGAFIPVQVLAVDADGIRVNEVSGPVSVQLVTAPAGVVVLNAGLNLVEGVAATQFMVPSSLPAVKLQATAGALSGQSAEFAIAVPASLFRSTPTVLFEDGFESGNLRPEWTITGTGTHRTQVVPNNGPLGSHHLVMDSSVNASDARNEATLTLDLRGRDAVELSFWMKESLDEDHAPPAPSFVGGADFDGVAISADGVNWHEIQGLRTVNGISEMYQEFKVDLSAAAAARGLTLGEAFKIRFNHFDNYTYGSDGFAFDDIRVTADVRPTPEPVLTLLHEDFESGVFGPHWRITGTQNHRTEITSAHSPRGGQHLLMDAHVSGVLSRNEATLSVDLSGMQDVMLKFWMKELGDEDHGPPALPFVDGADFDGVAISSNGVEWYEVQGLRSANGISSEYREFSVNLSQAAADHGLSLDEHFQIRFNHYDDYTFVSDGFAFDDIVIEARPVLALTLSAPAELAEGGSAGALVSLPAARGVDTVVELASNRPGMLNLPATLTIPAGSTESPEFTLTAAADTLLTGDLPVQITAAAAGYRRGTAEVILIDDEAPADLVLTLPAGLDEAGSIDGTVAVTGATPFALTVRLAVAPGIGLTWPAVVELPAGVGSAAFTLAKPENDLILEASSATVTASLGAASDVAVVTVTDNDALVPLIVTLPESVAEGGAPVAGSVGFAPPITSAVDLTIALASSDATELTVPASVTLSAGSAGATFDAVPQNDSLADGAVDVTVTASTAGLGNATRVIRVEDDELHHLVFETIASPQQREVPFDVTLRAAAIDGRTVPSFTGTAALTAAQGGVALTLTPTSTGTFVGGLWNGQVTLGQVADAAVLTADAGGGLTGSSNAFVVRSSARLVIAPGSLNVSLPAGEPAISVPLALSNPGGLTADWSATAHVSGQVAEPTLEVVRAALDNGFAGITSLVPNRYDFSDGTSGYYIIDGGNDMYDIGNYLSTNLNPGNYVNYANNGIVTSSLFGAGGRYFTRKHPGLFVLAADMVGLSHFEISGGLGADGYGVVDTAILTASRAGATFKGFVKRVHGAGNPSVNHLIIVQDDPALIRTASASTNEDQHRLAGLNNVTRLYYLLFACQQGGDVDDAQMQQILEAFLDATLGSQWLAVSPAQGSIAVGGAAATEAILKPANLAPGVHTGFLRFASNDAAAPLQEVPVTLTVAPAVDRFEWGNVSSPQVTNVPFAATLTAREAGGGTVTTFQGEADLRALRAAVETTSGAGTLSSSRPFDANSYYKSRSQLIYLPAEVGPAGIMRSISLDVAAMPTTLTDFVVRLKHTDKTSFAAAADAVWENEGWTTVFRSDLTVNALGWLVLPLSERFEYDGVRPLMVDFSFNNSTFGSSGSTYATSTPAYRGMSGGIYSGSSPLDWTGTSPYGYTTTWLPNLRFSTQTILPVSPARVAFTDGVWSGQLAVEHSGAGLILEAIHATRREVGGTSATFNVTSVGSLLLSVPSAGSEGGSLNATLTASTAPATDLVVALASDDVSEATVPAQVVLPAGQTSAGFVITLVDDSELDGPRPVAISAAALAYERATATLSVADNETTTVSLTLPASLNENSSSSPGQALLQLADAPTVDLSVSLSSSQPSHLTVPATVVVPAGQTSGGFVLTAPQNSLIEDPQNVVITATLAGSTPATGTVQVLDNESRALSLTLYYSSLSEGAAPSPTGGRVTLGGTVTAPLTLQLTSSDTSELTVPATVTVPAGANTSPYFSLTPVNDAAFDGSQLVAVTASASTFTNSLRTLTVLDDDVHHFTVSAVPAGQVRNAPFNVSFIARDVNGATISGYAGTPVLTAAEGSTPVAVSPDTVSGFAYGSRTVAVTVGDYAAAAVLTLTDPTTGGAGSSNAFAVGTGPHTRFGWNTVLSPQLPGQSFDVTLTAQDNQGNTITDYTGTAALSLPDYRQVGSATGNIMPPLDTYYPDSRTQILYTAGELGGAGAIRGLSLNVIKAPSQAMNAFTIRLRHSSKTDYSSGAVWETAGWTTCYQANETVSGSGWIQFQFTTPFAYNGTDSLMVDFSFNNDTSAWDSSARVASTYGTVTRTLYYQSYNSYGDPLLWAPGAGPYPSALLSRPDVRFEMESAQVVSPAITTAFVNGVWTGAVTVSQSGVAQALLAQDGAKVGLSNPFETVSEPLALDPEPVFTGGLTNTLSWNEPAPGLEYQVQRASSADFATPVTLDFQSGASASFDGLIDGQLYHYRVRMRRAGSLIWNSGWTPPVSSRQDASPPMLAAAPVTTLTAEAILSGTATDAAGVSEVRVADALVSSSDGFATWSTTVDGLVVGYNDLRVTASDGAVPPNTAEITVRVLRRGQQVIDFAGIPDQLATGSVQLTASGGASGNPVSFAVTSGPGVIQDQVLTFTGAGSVTVTASQAGDEIYLPAEDVSHTFSVSKAPAVVQLGSLAQIYDGTPRAVTATTTPAALAVALSYEGSATPPTAAGSYAVVATVNEALYQGSAAATLQISKAGQAIVFAPLADALTTDSIPLVASGGNSGNPVVFTVAEGPGVIAANVLTFTGAGSVTVTATQAGNADHLPADPVSHSMTVTKASSSIQFAGRVHVDDGTPRALSFSTDPEGLNYELLYEGEITAPALPGHYAVIATLDDPLYSGSGATSLTLLGLSGRGERLLSGSDEPQEANGSDFGPVVLGRVGTQTFTLSNPGTEAVALTGSPLVELLGEHAEDFQVSVPPAASIPPGGSVSFEIRFAPTQPGVRQAEVRVACTALANGPVTFAVAGFGALPTPLAQSITFNLPASLFLSQGPVALSATASSGLPVSLSVLSGPAVLEDGWLNLTGAGTVKVEARQEGGGNHAAAKPVVRTLQVKVDPEGLTLAGLQQTYDGTPRPVTVLGAEEEVTLTYVIDKQPSATPPTLAGSYPVEAVAGGVTRKGTLVIARAPLIVHVQDQRRLVGQANPVLSYAIDGLLGADTEATVLTAPITLKTKAKETSPPGLYPIVSSGGAALNYTLLHRPGTLVVEGHVGSFEALLRDPDSGEPAGLVKLTVPASGRSGSASLMLGEQAKPLALAGPLEIDEVSRSASARWSRTVKSRDPATGAALTEVYELALALSPFGELRVEVEKNTQVIAQADDGTRLQDPVKGQRVPQFGAYTAVLELLGQGEGPAAPGWATIRVDAGGLQTLTGRLGDGTAFSASLRADLRGEYRLFAQPYKRAGAHLGGAWGFREHAQMPGLWQVRGALLTWVKSEGGKDAGYRSGFGPLTVELGVDAWQMPSKTVGLAPLLGVEQFEIEHAPTGSESEGQLPTLAALAKGNALLVLSPQTTPLNARKWKAKISPTTGAFTGSFELQDAAQKRKVSFSGVLRQQDDAAQDGLQGSGHLVLPPLKGEAEAGLQTGALRLWRPQ